MEFIRLLQLLQASIDLYFSCFCRYVTVIQDPYRIVSTFHKLLGPLLVPVTFHGFCGKGLPVDSPLHQMYPVELEIKYAMESNIFASNLDLLLSIEKGGRFHTSIYDKRDDFKNVPLHND